MAANTTASADLAPRHAARKAAPLKDEDPGLAGVGVFKSVQQNSRMAPRAHDCDQPAMAGQQAIVVRPTMSSLELVEFINSHRSTNEAELRHDHFMAKVPKVLGPSAPRFRDSYVHPQNGQQYPCYRFPKREACLMAMSYSYELQAKVFDRMTQLEQIAAAPALPDFTDPAAAAEAWAEQFRAKQALALENRQHAEALAIAAPKAGALDRIAIETEGAVSLRVAAKIAQVPEKQFIAFLLEQRWLYRQRDGGGLLGYADREKAGLIELKRVEIPRPDRPPKVVARVLLTQRGIAKAVELVERKAPGMRKTERASKQAKPQLTLSGAPADGLVPGGAP